MIFVAFDGSEWEEAGRKFEAWRISLELPSPFEDISMTVKMGEG
jgi:hypothetical protein